MVEPTTIIKRLKVEVEKIKKLQKVYESNRLTASRPITKIQTKKP